MGQLQDPSGQLDLTALASNITYLLLGVYGWEYVVLFHVECALLCRRLSFRPSLIPYIIGRVGTLIYLTLHAVGRSSYSKSFSCIPSTYVLSIAANLGVGCFSTNFVIRAWVVWTNSRLVHAALLFLVLGHWTMLTIDVVNTRAISAGNICDVYPNYPKMDAITLIYTVIVDFFVLVLLVVGLSTDRSKSALKRRLRAQGILYCVMAGVAYISTVVVVLLHTPTVFNIMSDIAIVTAAIVSSRAVVSLRSLATCDSDHAPTLVTLTTQIEVEHTVL